MSEVTPLVRKLINLSVNYEHDDRSLYNAIINGIDKAFYESAIIMTGYHQGNAAKSLNISRHTLRNRLQEFFGNKYIGTRADKYI